MENPEFDFDGLVKQSRQAEQETEQVFRTIHEFEDRMVTAAIAADLPQSEQSFALIRKLALAAVMCSEVEDPDSKRNLERDWLARFMASRVPPIYILLFCEQSGIDPLEPEDPILDEVALQFERETMFHDSVLEAAYSLVDELGIEVGDGEIELIELLQPLCRVLAEIGRRGTIDHGRTRANLIERFIAKIRRDQLHPDMEILVARLFNQY